MKNTHKLYTDVIAKSGSKNEPLEVTENGVYEAPKGIGYSPVNVNVPQTVESGTLKSLLDETKSAYYLFNEYYDINVDGLISYSDTANVTNMQYMFYRCMNITTIPELNTSNVTIMSHMFDDCSNLITIPLLDTSKVKEMSQMFYYCEKLTSIPKLDTSNTTEISGMFQDCYKLTTIPELNTSKVTSMHSTFCNCTSLTSIPLLNTSNVTSMESMFSGCIALTSVPALDASKCTYFNDMFYKCTSLTSIGMYGFTRSIDISPTALGHDALVAFLNQAGTAYNSSQKIKLGSSKLALLSDEEKAIATNKGWTLA